MRQTYSCLLFGQFELLVSEQFQHFAKLTRPIYQRLLPIYSQNDLNKMIVFFSSVLFPPCLAFYLIELGSEPDLAVCAYCVQRCELSPLQTASALGRKLSLISFTQC